ncbi:GGDEF domain-containing protein [Marinicrinis sediminis]|uniref:GGDEF domain-containing protein n=1 Tax=Marinicrinis sediminis TaxID=1652465 RepID=A0ABW5R7G3_9BACL
MTWEKYVYRFVWFSLCVGAMATTARWILAVSNGTGDVIEYYGGPIAICVEVFLAVTLWRKPHVIGRVLQGMYWFMTVGISVKLGYVLFVSDDRLYSQFVQLSPWMYIQYVLPFLIYGGHRKATVVSSVVFSGWVLQSGIYVIIQHDQELAEKSELLSVFIQTYVAQGILIVFMALYARLKRYYLDAQKSAGDMEQMASTDFLLNIPNRRAIELQFTKQLSEAQQSGNHLSVMMMDIDHFKQINDTYGHQAGDAVLIEISLLLRELLREPISFGRWGGEEFLIVMPLHAEQANAWAEQIRSRLEAHDLPSGPVTASFGIAEYKEGDDANTLLQRADQALYTSKEQGRNRVELG